MDLNNVLHTHIDGIGCTEKFLEASQLKISSQYHHFLHILALSQTSESTCQGVWKFKNRYVCTFCGLGCVLSMIWSRNFFCAKVWSQTSISKLSLVCGTSQKNFLGTLKVTYCEVEKKQIIWKFYIFQSYKPILMIFMERIREYYNFLWGLKFF